MTDPNHGNSIITRLRLICEEMYNERHNMSAAAGLRSQAENLLPLADVDDIEVIVLREAAAILNGRGWHDLSDKVEAAGDAFSAEDAATASMTQSEAETIAYDAINTFITRSANGIPLTHEGLNTVRNAAQQALERHAPGQWVVDAALPDSDWSRTPAVTVRPAPDTRWHKDGFRPGSID